MTNLAAFPREPNMLPDDEVRAWMHVYYSSAPNIAKPAEYWKWVNSGWYPESREWLKPDDDIKKLAATLITGAGTDDEKLKKIYDFTQTEIKNIAETVPADPEDWKKVEDNSPSDTLKLKIASPDQVDRLFGALAEAAGFDVRAAYTGDRREHFFDPNIANSKLMLKVSLIAIRTGEQWRYFSPASWDVPYGMVSWVLEDQTVMITDRNGPIWQIITLSAPDRSAAKRSGRFKLMADGSLQGEARIEFNGHWAIFKRAANRGDSKVEVEESFKTYIKNTISPTAEVENLKVEDVRTGTKPYIYSFKVRVPDYVVRTGKRMFFQPNVFERNTKPRFSAGTRISEVYFTYPWSELDDVTIELPNEYLLENADAPAPIRDAGGIAKHDTKMTVTSDGRTLSYSRSFSFGGGGAIRFPAASYPVLKNMFDAFTKADTHQLTLIENTPPKTLK
jgi:hypothetical protein